MRLRSQHVLVAVSMSVLALTACSGDEPSAGGDPTAGGTTAAGADPAGPSDSQAPTLPEIPTDVPTELPSGFPTDLGFGEQCAEVQEALADAFAAMGAIATDPAGAQTIFTEIAQALRDAAAVSEPAVAAAAEDVAAAYEELAASVQSGGPPDLGRITEASAALQAACAG